LGTALILGAFDARVHDTDDIERLASQGWAICPDFLATKSARCKQGVPRRRCTISPEWRWPDTPRPAPNSSSISERRRWVTVLVGAFALVGGALSLAFALTSPRITSIVCGRFYQGGSVEHLVQSPEKCSATWRPASASCSARAQLAQ